MRFGRAFLAKLVEFSWPCGAGVKIRTGVRLAGGVRVGVAVKS